MKERAFIVLIQEENSKDIWTIEDKLDEMRELVESSGCQIVGETISRVRDINPRYFIGKGKVSEIKEKAKDFNSDVVIFSKDLSATQQLNLEDEIGVKTIDRTQLILDIFVHHAKGSEGKLQVELAQLIYLLPRLKGKGILLSQLGAGIGTRGPGEKKLEVDRRRIRRRIEKLGKELKEVEKRRKALRKRRRISEIPTIAIVGYTNAGKTTLLNLLTGSLQRVSDSMFTTLDPVSRGYYLPGRQRILFSDTVGFLSDLPHHLIEAFKATLEEILDASLILHILDISHPLAQKREKVVYEVLNEIGVKDIPIITILNKIDKIEPSKLESLKINYPSSIFISALDNIGIDELLLKIKEYLYDYESWLKIYLPKGKTHLIELLNPQRIVECISKDGGIYLKARVNLATRERFYKELTG